MQRHGYTSMSGFSARLGIMSKSWTYSVASPLPVTGSALCAEFQIILLAQCILSAVRLQPCRSYHLLCLPNVILQTVKTGYLLVHIPAVYFEGRKYT